MSCKSQLGTFEANPSPRLLKCCRISELTLMSLPQEVGSLAKSNRTPDGFLNSDHPQLQLHPDISDHWVVCTGELESHLGQALLMDSSYADCILTALKGNRFIGLKSSTAVLLTCRSFLGTSLTTNNPSMINYTAAIQEMKHFLARSHGTLTI